MVLMALITTFMTTPLVKWIYPHKYHTKYSLTDETQVSLGVLGKTGIKQVPLADMTSHIHILLCIPPVPAIPLLMNIVQMLANYNKKTNQKILVNTAQMIEVTDRYSSVLMATNPLTGDDSLTPLIEGFGRLNGVKISNQKIISSPEHFPEDLVEVVTTEHIDVLFYPWQVSSDHDEVQDSTSEVLFELLKICPSSVGILVNSGLSSVINMSESKILVPFFGGPDDRESVELALSFGILTCIVRYKCDRFDESDEELIKKVIQLSENDPSVIYSEREFDDTAEGATTSVRVEVERNNFSLIVLGRSSMSESDDPSEFEQVLGRLAGKLFDDRLSMDMLVVSCGGNSAGFMNLNRED